MRLAPSSAGALTLHAADEAGDTVVTAEAVTLRPVPTEQLTTGGRYRCGRRPVPGGVG
ncbi:hypothetical protein LT493_21870 [Streptomyces tricolor]|nr:hypothetical protein [Streptomyces tricolor]